MYVPHNPELLFLKIQWNLRVQRGQSINLIHILDQNTVLSPVSE